MPSGPKDSPRGLVRRRDKAPPQTKVKRIPFQQDLTVGNKIKSVLEPNQVNIEDVSPQSVTICLMFTGSGIFSRQSDVWTETPVNPMVINRTFSGRNRVAIIRIFTFNQSRLPLKMCPKTSRTTCRPPVPVKDLGSMAP
ncbi:hypothetical protein TNCV_954141 [Trichonephila clavipes]|nr:hypothetical protein TNCV_954141 [Trichonephila clavipes]